MSLVFAHNVQAELSRLQQSIRDFLTQRKSHLRMQASLPPNSIGNDPRQWLGIISQTKTTVASLRQEVAFLVNSLPANTPMGVRVTVNGTKAAIGRDLLELDRLLAQSEMAVRAQLNDPLRTSTGEPTGTMDVVLGVAEIVKLAIDHLKKRKQA